MVPFSIKRKIILAGAIVVCAFILTFVFYLGSLYSYIKLLLSLTPPVFGLIQFVAAAGSAAIITELLRVGLPTAKRWSEKKHFAVVVIMWLSLFFISVILRVGWKASYIKTLISDL